MAVDPLYLGVTGFVFPTPDVGGGTCDYPLTTDVRNGVSYASGVSVGVLESPSESDVREGVGYGADGTEFTGTLVIPVSPPPPLPIPTGDNVTTTAPSCIIRQLIIDLGLVPLPWKAYCPYEPESPDTVITIQDTEGQDLGRVQSNYRSEMYGFQVRVRARDAEAAYGKAAEIGVSLDEQAVNRDVTVNGVTYLVQSIVRRGKVMGLGKAPDSRRSIATFNGLAVISQRSTE